MKLIREYACQWNPTTKQGQLSLRTEEDEVTHIMVDSLADMAGLLLILHERPVGVFSDGTIGTTWEAVGEQDTTI
jgi:hypothetical protein